MTKRADHDSAQEELALSSIASHALFPGRTTLYVSEVATALGMSQQQVVDLIEEHQATGGESGLLAVDIASGLKSKRFAQGNKTPRAYWRIPVSAYDAFIAKRKSA